MAGWWRWAEGAMLESVADEWEWEWWWWWWWWADEARAE
jgi:hypothetical protein